jgi:hypothetical protein
MKRCETKNCKRRAVVTHNKKELCVKCFALEPADDGEDVKENIDG